MLSNVADGSVSELKFEPNKNVQYLPTYVHEKFPKVKKILAADLALLDIHNKNFRYLSYLTYIDLNGNQIEIVLSDTFNEIWRLLYLDLSKYSEILILFRFQFLFVHFFTNKFAKENFQQ